MSDAPTAPDKPSDDASFWLYEYQKLVHNLRYWVANGKSETAVKEIDHMTDRWRMACDREQRIKREVDCAGA